jgi:SH3 domain-containing YSC84-like protein 1
MKAKILSYSRSRGAFAGVSLAGTSLSQDEEANKAVYGKQLNADAILAGGMAIPAGAKPLTQVLTKYSPKGI